MPYARGRAPPDQVAGDDAAEPERSDAPERRSVVGMGSQQLNQMLGGGIPLGSLTFIEGTPKSGKSVLCQHTIHESLLDGHGVTCFVSDTTASDLRDQMRSIGLHVSAYVRSETLRIRPVIGPSLVEDPDHVFTPDQMMGALAQEFERIPENHVIIVDDITALASESEDRTTLRFFSSCRRLCDDGRTIILAAQSYAVDERMLLRLRDLCDAYLRLKVEQLGAKQGTTVEVVRANKVELHTSNIVSFEVRPEVGIQTVAFGRFSA